MPPATSALPYRRVKGRATDFVPQPEGVKLPSAQGFAQTSGQSPRNEAISTPTPWASG